MQLALINPRMQQKTSGKNIHVIHITQKHTAVPKSWDKAAGVVRNKKKSLENHAKKVRNEWGS